MHQSEEFINPKHPKHVCQLFKSPGDFGFIFLMLSWSCMISSPATLIAALIIAWLLPAKLTSSTVLLLWWDCLCHKRTRSWQRHSTPLDYVLGDRRRYGLLRRLLGSPKPIYGFRIHWSSSLHCWYPQPVSFGHRKSGVHFQGPDDHELSSSFPFREVVGCLMYAMVTTRIDIAFAVSRVAKFTSKPHNTHWTAVKRIFHYLAGTSPWVFLILVLSQSSLSRVIMILIMLGTTTTESLL